MEATAAQKRLRLTFKIETLVFIKSNSPVPIESFLFLCFDLVTLQNVVSLECTSGCIYLRHFLNLMLIFLLSSVYLNISSAVS